VRDDGFRIASAGAGAVTRETPMWLHAPVGPWGGRVKVVPITGLSEGTRFEVIAEWTGPGLDGLPIVSGPVAASDLYVVDDVAWAVRVAKAAVDHLRDGRVPPLRELAARLRVRA